MDRSGDVIVNVPTELHRLSVVAISHRPSACSGVNITREPSAASSRVNNRRLLRLVDKRSRRKRWLLVALIALFIFLIVTAIVLCEFIVYKARQTSSSASNLNDSALNLLPSNHILATLSYHNFSMDETAKNCEASSECRQRAALMEMYMDTSVNPCVDFFKYACGNLANVNNRTSALDSSDDYAMAATILPLSQWLPYSHLNAVLEQHLSSGDSTLFESVKFYENRDNQVRFEKEDASKMTWLSLRLLHILSGNESSSSSLIRCEAQRKAQRYFKACNARLSKRGLFSTAFGARQIADALGGFRLDNTTRAPDLSSTLSRILAFTSNSLFHIDITNFGYVKIGLGNYHLMPREDDVKKVFEFILGVNLTQDVALQVDRVVGLERQLDSSLRSLLRIAHNDTSSTFRDFQQKYSFVDWKLVFDGLSTVTKYSEQTYHLISYSSNSVGYLQDFIANMTMMGSEQDRRDLHNYLVLTAILPHFNEAAQLPLSMSLPMWCLKDAIETLPFAVGSLVDSELSKSKLRAMFADVWKQLRKDVALSTNLNNKNVKKSIITTLDDVRFEIGLPLWTLNLTRLDNYYAHFEPTDNALLNSVSKFRFKYRQRWSLNQVVLADKETDEFWARQLLSPNPNFRLDANEIYIDTGILQPPFYGQSFTDAFNFGAIAFIFGHELSHVVELIEDQYLTDRLACLSKQPSPTSPQSFPEDEDYEDAAINTKEEDLADVSGLQLVYSVFKALPSASATALPTRMPISGLEFSPRQTFFIAFAQNFCEQLKDDIVRGPPEDELHSPWSVRVNGTLTQLDDFASTFSCPVNSPMNPADKCKSMF